MATDLIMPTLPGEQEQSRHFLPLQRPQHNRSQSYQIPQSTQISPLSTSTSTGSNSSTPSSPKSGRKPMYMPAVLRSNHEFPPHPKLAKSRTFGEDDDARARHHQRTQSGNAFGNFPGFGVLSPRSRRPSKVGQELCDGWDLKLFPQVTAQPTRQHWKPDPESSICDDPTCKRNFNYFNRRHHCRRCGNIFCDWHSSYVVPLDQDANFNPRATPSRTCHHCFDQFKAWHSRNNSQSSSATSSEAAGVDVSGSTTPTAAVAAGGKKAAVSSAEVAASVPRDWNWSTF